METFLFRRPVPLSLGGLLLSGIPLLFHRTAVMSRKESFSLCIGTFGWELSDFIASEELVIQGLFRALIRKARE